MTPVFMAVLQYGRSILVAAVMATIDVATCASSSIIFQRVVPEVLRYTVLNLRVRARVCAVVLRVFEEGNRPLKRKIKDHVDDT
jgi:hypothetical protein